MGVSPPNFLESRFGEPGKVVCQLARVRRVSSGTLIQPLEQPQLL